MSLKYNTIQLFSTLWLALGIIVFLLGFCKIYYALPVVCGMIWIIAKQYKNNTDRKDLKLSYKHIGFVIFIALLLNLLCGIGGYVVQPNDHFGRNAIFSDIVNYEWPIYDKGQNLYMCYYLAFWTVPALFGKLFHSLDVGFAAQLIWMTLGSVALYLEVSRYMKKARLTYFAFIYLFAGLKIVECLLYLPIFGDSGWMGYMFNVLATNSSPTSFHAGPIVQLLYDPFNQTIPLFLCMMLIFNNLKSKYIPFIYALIFLYAPFPFIGLTPIVFYLFLKNNSYFSNKESWIKVFSFENIIALLVIIIVAFYFSANINGSHKGIRPITNLIGDVYGFAIYMIFEFIIFFAIGYKVCHNKPILWIALGSVILFGWFQVGLHNDFCFRTNMPLIFILALLLIKRYYDVETSKRMRCTIVILLLLGGVPAQIHPFLRYISTYFVYTHQNQVVLNQYQKVVDVKNMYIMQQTKTRNDDLKSTFNCGSWGWMCDSFKGKPDSFFFKYIAK